MGTIPHRLRHPQICFRSLVALTAPVFLSGVVSVLADGTTPLGLTEYPQVRAPRKCKETLTEVPPFFTTTVAKNKKEEYQLSDQPTQVEDREEGRLKKTREVATERLLEEKRRDTDRYRLLSRGSVVSVEPATAKRLAHADRRADFLVPVRVLSEERRYSQYMPGPALKGTQGFLWNKALKKASNREVYVLKEDAKLFSMNGLVDRPFGAGTLLKPLMTRGKYRALRCLTPDGTSGSLSYLFSYYSPEKKRFVDTMEIGAAPACELGVMSDAHLGTLQELASSTREIYRASQEYPLGLFEINDWGMVRLPTRKIQDSGDGITEEALDGSFVHYQGFDPEGSDTWGTPDSVCSLMRIARDWKASCPEQDKKKCTLQIGDLSFVTPGKVVDGVKDPLGHKSHYHGSCVDMRPFRKDGQFGRVDLRTDEALYDRELMRKFVSFVISRGATPVYFNDPSIYQDRKLGQGKDACSKKDPRLDIGKRAQYCPAHDDHIHFCLEPSRVEGC